MSFDPLPGADPAEASDASPWPLTGARAVRWLAVGFGAMLLSYAGALTFAPGAWGALALPSGLALAGALRWGWPVLPLVALGTLPASAGLGSGLGTGVAAAGALLIAAFTACWILRRTGFDTRLERARDVGLLALAAPLACVLPALAVAIAWEGGDAARIVPAWVAGIAMLGLGMVLGALALLAIDRRMLQSLQLRQAGRRWSEAAGGGGALAAMLALLATVPAEPPALALLALMLPHVVATWLVLRGQLALACVGLVLAVLLLFAGGAPAAAALPGPSGEGAALGVWLASALALVLAAQAAAADAQGRVRRWAWALDGSRLGVADWRVPPRQGFASAAWRTMTGHAAPDWSPRDWLRTVHPDDQAALHQAIDLLSEGRAGRLQVELRIARPAPVDPGAEHTTVAGGQDGRREGAQDGRDRAPKAWHWFQATLLVTERGLDGRPRRLLATLADAQERRDAQERQLMSVNLFQHLHEGLLVTDDELHALDVNPAYSQILGVPREQVLGTVPSLLRPAPADPVARQQRAVMWASLREQGSWRGELLERRHDGTSCTLQTTISAVHGPAGDLRYHVLVISDISEQRAQRARLERQAHFDELTRLPNRARLAQLLDDAMRAADHDGYLLVVCYLDLDHFKPVNDRFGHAAGDRLLAELAGRLRGALRSREHWTDIAARLGGDEFVLLLRSGTIEEARLAVERVLRVVAQPYVIDPAAEAVQVTASMGATIYPIDRSDAETLLRHADHAMYGAKQSGRNGYLFFDPEHRRRTEERVLAIGRVQEALDQQEFVLYYQPKVDMRSGRVLGLEGLLRWDHPQQGLIAPQQFLPLIENTGLSSRIGDWVISQALGHLEAWRRDGLEISVGVNVSARHLQEPDFAQRLTELLARHPEPLAPWFEIEMLETAAHADIEATSALVERCRALGVRFALDDFGTGYSTLSYLKRLPVDVLKIDRSFVHHMLDDVQDRAIVEGVVGLARTFGCEVVAEGVESPAQARTLLELGCEVGQGTGIAAPMRADQVAAWVRDYRGMFALGPASAVAPPGATAGNAAD